MGRWVKRYSQDVSALGPRLASWMFSAAAPPPRDETATPCLSFGRWAPACKYYAVTREE